MIGNQAEARKQHDLDRLKAQNEIEILLKKQEALQETRQHKIQELEAEARRRKMKEALRLEVWCDHI